MTLAAIVIEITPVYIVLVMAVDTETRARSAGLERAKMATVAMQFFVRTAEAKVGLVVVEIPDQPVVRVMTALAGSSQRQFVSVVASMTIDAIGTGVLERGSQMAGFATGHRMLADEREFAELVIETNVFQPPGRFVVTLVALFAFLAEVRILVFVAAVTVAIGLVGVATFLVAGLATGVSVRASQREIGFPVVIEFRFQPAFLSVTTGALPAVTALMDIIETVTLVAAAGFTFVFQAGFTSGGMTGMTGNRTVFAQQPEFRVPVMLEVCLRPFFFAVTVFALAAESFAVHVF